MSVVVADSFRDKEAPAQPTSGPNRAHRLPTTPAGLFSIYKNALDITMAFFLVILTAPIVVLAMLVIKLTSRGPVLYTQTRLGRDGKPFLILKLRTMVFQCESLTGARWATPNDPRVTLVGRVLRKTHLDELPQLWNVLDGDMSLVGPRPERPEFVPQLEQAVPHYRRRLLMKPGVTGLAQIQLPPDTNLASVRLKLAYDLHYLRHAGPWLDLRILLGTGCKLLAVPFRVLRQLFGFPKPEIVEQAYKRLPQDPALAPSRAQTA